MKLSSGQTANIPAFMQETRETARFFEHFQMAIDAIPTGMLMLDAAGTITLLNTPIEVMFGYTRAELLGQPIRILFATLVTEHYKRLHDALFSATDTRATGGRREVQGLRKDGVDLAIEMNRTQCAP